MDLVTIAAVLLLFLGVLLAGGVWIGIALMACGFVGMQFVAGGIPAGPVLATKIWGNSASWELAALLIGCGFIGFFAWHASWMTYDSWRFNDMAQVVLAVPLWIPQLGYSGGLVILLIAFVDELVHVARGGAPRYEKSKPATAEEAVEQAVQSAV